MQVDLTQRSPELALAGPSLPDTVQRLLHAVRRQIGMDVAWVSEFLGDEQVFRVVDAEPGAAAPRVGARSALTQSFCARVLDGRVPQLIPDARHEPAVALLDIGRELQIGAYLGVPLLAADGTTAGMLCAASNRAVPALGERDVATLRLLAQLLHDLQQRASGEQDLAEVRAAQRVEVQRAVAGGDRRAVLQPVVDARSGALAVLEGLSRFSSPRSPAQWFALAAHVDLGRELELAAARSCLDLLGTPAVPDGVAVAVNLSPATLSSGAVGDLLVGVDVSRVVVEVTEHRPVGDYAALNAVLRPWRAQGLRLAVDDAGAGYASLQHVLMCRPDLVKVDMALVRGIDADPARRALVAGLVAFAGVTGARVVAEGVETDAERDAVRALGVDYLQGYLIGPPA